MIDDTVCGCELKIGQLFCHLLWYRFTPDRIAFACSEKVSTCLWMIDDNCAVECIWQRPSIWTSTTHFICTRGSGYTCWWPCSCGSRLQLKGQFGFQTCFPQSSAPVHEAICGVALWHAINWSSRWCSFCILRGHHWTFSSARYGG